jgi:chorismate mutase
MADILADLRKQIDALDSQLVEMLTARLELSRKVSAAKTDNSHIFRPAREAQLLSRLLADAPAGLQPLIPVVWRAIISSSIAEQRPNFTIAASLQMRDIATNFSAGQLNLESFDSADTGLQALAAKKADILLVSPSELSGLAPWLGKDETAMVIARLPLVSPVSDTGKQAEIEGWIIGRPPAEQADGDRGVFYHQDGNRIEITELSRYEKISGVRLLGYCTPLRPDPE